MGFGVMDGYGVVLLVLLAVSLSLNCLLCVLLILSMVCFVNLSIVCFGRECVDWE